jgi:hypothetical protein
LAAMPDGERPIVNGLSTTTRVLLWTSVAAVMGTGWLAVFRTDLLPQAVGLLAMIGGVVMVIEFRGAMRERHLRMLRRAVLANPGAAFFAGLAFLIRPMPQMQAVVIVSFALAIISFLLSVAFLVIHLVIATGAEHDTTRET